MKKCFVLFLVACWSVVLFAQNEVPRYTLLEMFTSSTCGPCNLGNQNLHNILNQNDNVGGKYTLIKYQMNGPGSGDPYYTQEGGTRIMLYLGGATTYSIPWLHMDGLSQSTGTNHAKLLAAQSVPSYLEVSGNYNITGQTVTATIHVRPTMDISVGNNLRLYVAIVEKRTVNNKKNNGETVFFQVMKKFMPDANGIILGNVTACQYITKELSWEFKGKYRLPANAGSPINHNTEHSVEDFNNLEVVAWVQNVATKQIYNSCTAIKGDDFSINFDVINENGGTLTATINGDTVNSGDLVKPGSIVDFIAKTNEDWDIKEWRINSCEILDGSTDSFSVTMDASQRISVHFTREYSVDFDIANEYGAISAIVNGTPVNSGDDIEEGSIIQFTAAPIEGYVVKEWKLNGNVVPNNTSNTYSLTLNGDANVTVEFKAFMGVITYSVVYGNGMLAATIADTLVTSGIEALPGATIEFTATPNAGYKVKEWKHNNLIVNDNTTHSFSLVVIGNEKVTVEFMKTTGINVNNLYAAELFPNPMTTELIINNAESVQKVIITNTLGQIVKEEVLTGKNMATISTQNLQSGIFFVTLKNDEGSEIIKKIIKN